MQTDDETEAAQPEAKRTLSLILDVAIQVKLGQAAEGGNGTVSSLISFEVAGPKSVYDFLDSYLRESKAKAQNGAGVGGRVASGRESELILLDSLLQESQDGSSARTLLPLLQEQALPQV